MRPGEYTNLPYTMLCIGMLIPKIITDMIPIWIWKYIYWLVLGTGTSCRMSLMKQETPLKHPYHFWFICDFVLFTLLLLFRSVFVLYIVFCMQVVLLVKNLFDLGYSVFRYSVFDFGTLCSTLGTLCSTSVLCVRL